MDRDLQGIHIVVTRPAHQADDLCQLIESEGGSVIRFPVLGIAEPKDSRKLDDVIDRLAQFDVAIFISPNAVSHAMKKISDRDGLPRHLQIAAVGQATAKSLASYGLVVDLFPKDSFNSEALLAMTQLQQVEGKKIVIFRGEGGRELLADTLRERGAHVEYAECYRRIRPDNDVQPLLQQGEKNEVDIIIVTSNEGLHNLMDMVGVAGRHWLLQTPLLLVSQRTAELARQLGFTQTPIIATKASDDAILQSLIEWRRKNFRKQAN